MVNTACKKPVFDLNAGKYGLNTDTLLVVKNKESSKLKYWDVNNFYGLEMSLKLPTKINDFKWIEDVTEFDGSL